MAPSGRLPYDLRAKGDSNDSIHSQTTDLQADHIRGHALRLQPDHFNVAKKIPASQAVSPGSSARSWCLRGFQWARARNQLPHYWNGKNQRHCDSDGWCRRQCIRRLILGRAARRTNDWERWEVRRHVYCSLPIQWDFPRDPKCGRLFHRRFLQLSVQERQRNIGFGG